MSDKQFYEAPLTEELVLVLENCILEFSGENLDEEKENVNPF